MPLKLFLFSLMLLILPVRCLELFWPRKNTLADNIRPVDAQELNNIDGLLNKEDIASLRINFDALQAYSQKPDCFKKAASYIRARCTDLDMDEGARINAAISMTLCELATARHYSLPLECAPYSVKDGRPRGTISSRVQGECVDALARSAQFWSSYSGYLREVPQLCHAFRRWNDIDLARNIYYNATVEKIALIRFMANRERKLAGHVDELTLSVTEMKQNALALRVVLEEQQIGADRLARHLTESIDAVMLRLRDENQRLIKERGEMEVVSSIRFESALMETIQHHTSGLDGILNTLEPTILSRLGNLFANHESRHQKLDLLMMDHQARWMELGVNMNLAQQEMLRLSDQATDTSHILAVALSDGRIIRELQSEVTDSMADLVKTVAQLSDTTQIELDKINGSAYLIRQHLEVQRHQSLWPWKNWLIKALELIYSADPGFLNSIEKAFLFRVLLSVAGFIWAVFRMAVPFSAVRFLSLGRAPSQVPAPAPDWGARGAHVACLQNVALVLFVITRKFVIRKSARVVSAAMNYAVSSISQTQGSEILPGGKSKCCAAPEDPCRRRMSRITVAGIPSLRERGDGDYRPRISRIPERLCHGLSTRR